MRSSLSETQRLFLEIIAQPGGAARAIEGLPAEAREAAMGLVRGYLGLDAASRCDIYSHMYFFRIRDVLQEDFPAVHGVLGEDLFDEMVAAYLLACPPSHYSLRYVGNRLAGFLGTWPGAREHSYLPSLVDFEYAMLDAFDAADADPIESEVLAAIAPEDWSGLQFVVTPSLRLLAAQAPITEIWRRACAREPIAEVIGSPTSIRVWRQNMKVWHRVIDPAESRALEALRAGETFGEICQSLSTEVGDSLAPQRAVTLIRTWLEDGLLVGLA